MKQFNNNRNYQQNYNRKQANWLIRLAVLVCFISTGTIVYEVAGYIKPSLVSQKVSVLSSQEKYDAACRAQSYEVRCGEENNREQQLKDEIVLVRDDAKLTLFSLIIMLITAVCFLGLARKNNKV
ncbi:MAG: hypothetical protein LBR35_00630 [Rickettsiales bacterium]|jgi:hypothetical protein|nr:hypothetical protein [Rickettsiales bacterium]